MERVPVDLQRSIAQHARRSLPQIDTQSSQSDSENTQDSEQEKISAEIQILWRSGLVKLYREIGRELQEYFPDTRLLTSHPYGNFSPRKTRLTLVYDFSPEEGISYKSIESEVVTATDGDLGVTFTTGGQRYVDQNYKVGYPTRKPEESELFVPFSSDNFIKDSQKALTSALNDYQPFRTHLIYIGCPLEVSAVGWFLKQKPSRLIPRKYIKAKEITL